MKLISYDGYTFSSGGYSANIDDANSRGGFDLSPVVQPRPNASPLLIAGMANPRVIQSLFTYDGTGGLSVENAFSRLLGKLRARTCPPGGRTLVAQRNDGTLVQAQAVVTIPFAWDPEQSVNFVAVTFTVVDLAWVAQSTTSDGPATFGTDNTRTFTVLGYDEVSPLLKIGWSVQRNPALSTPDVGWSYRKRIPVTNNGDQAFRNQIVQLGPINTASLVTAGKMQSDCDDLVVFDERGRRLRHGIAGTNSRGTFLTFILSELAAGDSTTLDVCYGNTAALRDNEANGFPYSYPGSPAPDITGIDGLATGGSTSSMTTGGVSVDQNRFVSGTLILTKSATAVGGQYRRIGSHTTGGVFTPTRNFTSAPTSSTRYVIVAGPFMGDGGQASATTSTTLTDSAQSWNANEWIGATVEIITLDTDMGAVLQKATVTGNTATQLTVDSWPSGTPSSSAMYRVSKQNANYRYQVEQVQRGQTNHRGRWRLNKGGGNPSQMWFANDGAPGAWNTTTYNPANAQNDYCQLRVTGVDMGGGDYDYFSILNARMARKDSADLPDEGFANGVEISIPLGILGIRQNYQFRNPSGMCRAVFGCRDRGGEDWELYEQDSSVQATLVTRPTNYYDLTQFGTPHHLLAALTSDDDAAIEKEQGQIAQLMDGSILEVRVDSRNLVVGNFETANEETIYDLTLNVRRAPTINLLTNGDFATSISGWGFQTSNGSDSGTWDGTTGNLALGSYKVIKNAGARTNGWVYTNPKITVGIVPGTPYLVSASYKGTAAVGGALSTVWFDASNNFLGESASSPVAATTSWQRLTHTATAPASAARLELRLRFDSDTVGGTIWFEDLVLQDATIAEDIGQDLIRIGRNDCHCFLATGEKIWIGPIGDVPLACRIYSGSTFVRDVPAAVEIFTVEADYLGVATRYISSSPLPLQPGLVTYRVTDPDGAIGAITVETIYRASYL